MCPVELDIFPIEQFRTDDIKSMKIFEMTIFKKKNSNIKQNKTNSNPDNISNLKLFVIS